MGYVRDMRASIGHRPLLIVGASVIVVNAQGEVLLQRRVDNGLWGYHGGCVELYENTQDAARRELYEETGLTAGEMTLLGVFSGKEIAYTYPNGDQASIGDVVYVCRDYSGELRAQADEVSALRWFAPEALPSEISPPNLPALRAFLRGA